MSKEFNEKEFLKTLSPDAIERYKKERQRMQERMIDIFAPVSNSRSEQERIVKPNEIKRTDSFCHACLLCGELRNTSGHACSRHGPQIQVMGYTLLAFMHILDNQLK